MKRITLFAIAVLLSVLTVFCFAACHTENDPEETSVVTDASSDTASDDPGETQTGEPAETDTELQTEPVTEAETIGDIISSPDASAFRIVRAADASDTAKEAADYLSQSLGAAFGTAPAVVDDAAAYTEGSYEILIGKTNRQTAPLADSNDARAWCVKVSDHIISLDAVNEAYLFSAADRLVKGYANGSEILKLSMITDYTFDSAAFGQLLHFFVPGEPTYTVVFDPADGNDAAFTAMWFSKSYTARGFALGMSDTDANGPSVRLDVDAGLDTDWKVTFDDKGNITVSGRNRDALSWGLTVLTSTRMTPDHCGEILISDTSSMSGDMSACSREGWGLPIPAYEGGTLSEIIYNDGAGIENDSKEPAYSQSYMMGVGGTSREEFDAYIEKLLSFGYVPEGSTVMKSPKGENCYGQYVCGVSTVYAYFLAATKEARIVDDRASVPESVFEDDYIAAPDEAADVILYGIHMHPLGINSNEQGGDPNINNCGEFMMIRLPDNGLILIDGGSKLQATDAAVDGAWNYMHEITGTSYDEKLRISCWFITHAHADHCMIVSKLLEKYGDMIEVERVMFNFPHADTVKQSLSQAARTPIIKYCPDALVMKCHAGQSIRLGGVVLDVITTHEDLVGARKGISSVAEVNSTSTVLRVTLPDGQRALILGDMTAANETVITKHVHKTELAARMVQVAHHAWNRLTNMYKYAAAEYALWPQYEYTNFVEINNHRTLAYEAAKILDKCGAKYHYFAGVNTARLTCQNGEITVTLTDPIY